MSSVDIHPEHLFDRVRHGVANETEQRELAMHLQRCSACALEWQLAEALREPAREPIALNEDAIDGALAALMSEGRLHSSPESASGLAWRGRFVPWAAALCLFFTGSAAAATLIMAVRQNSVPARSVQDRGDKIARGARAALPSTEATRAAPQTPATDTSQPTASVATPSLVPTVGTAPARSALAPQSTPAAPRDLGARHPREARAAASQQPAASADELFQQARAAMLRGEQQSAVALCLSLQARFTASSQAQVSRVLLGRLFLEQLQQPSAALIQFDAYLERAGENRPEALLGRANALRALGRTQEEIETLRTLVGGYPGSLYIAPAEKRLRAIR